MKSLLDPTFRYTNAVDTNIRKTFARIRREAKAQAQVDASVAAEQAIKIAPLARRKPRDAA